MTPGKRFEREFFKLLGEIGEDGEMAFRVDSIAVVEQSVKAFGLDGIVRDYLATHYGADALDELSDDDLARAFRYIARLEKRAAPRQMVPVRADGEMLLVRGRFCWE